MDKEQIDNKIKEFLEAKVNASLKSIWDAGYAEGRREGIEQAAKLIESKSSWGPGDFTSVPISIRKLNEATNG